MSERREPFFERWSRLKQNERETAQEAAEQAEAPPPAQADERTPPLPKVEDLTPQSDFRPFMNVSVDPLTRRAALKKLFADAHFNIPDPFEPYSGDLTQAEPIPPELLKTLNQAKKLLFDEHEKTAQAKSQTDAGETPAGEAKDGGRSTDA